MVMKNLISYSSKINDSEILDFPFFLFLKKIILLTFIFQYTKAKGNKPQDINHRK